MAKREKKDSGNKFYKRPVYTPFDKLALNSSKDQGISELHTFFKRLLRLEGYEAVAKFTGLKKDQLDVLCKGDYNTAKTILSDASCRRLSEKFGFDDFYFIALRENLSDVVRYVHAGKKAIQNEQFETPAQQRRRLIDNLRNRFHD